MHVILHPCRDHDFAVNDQTEVSVSRGRAWCDCRRLLGRSGTIHECLTLEEGITDKARQCKPGVDAAPSALIASGLLDQLQEDLGYKLFYDGAVHSYYSIIPRPDPDYRNMKQPLAVSAVTRQLSQQVYEHARQGRYVLTLGGDHSIAIGTISGTAKAIRERLGQEMAVIWVDAHADVNTPETSGSGNIHGMPVAFLAGLATEKREDVFGWLQEDQKISLKKLVYIGLRDVDRGEKRILRDNGIKAFSMHDIDKYG